MGAEFSSSTRAQSRDSSGDVDIKTDPNLIGSGRCSVSAMGHLIFSCSFCMSKSKGIIVSELSDPSQSQEKVELDDTLPRYKSAWYNGLVVKIITDPYL